MSTYIYTFGTGQAEGSAEMRELLGNKGANLAEPASIGLAAYLRGVGRIPFEPPCASISFCLWVPQFL